MEEFNLQLLAALFETPGTLMIAFAALRVHHRVLNEHKIDNTVFNVMQREQVVGMVGVCLVLVGFIIELMHFL